MKKRMKFSGFKFNYSEWSKYQSDWQILFRPIWISGGPTNLTIPTLFQPIRISVRLTNPTISTDPNISQTNWCDYSDRSECQSDQPIWLFQPIRISVGPTDLTIWSNSRHASCRCMSIRAAAGQLSDLSSKAELIFLALPPSSAAAARIDSRHAAADVHVDSSCVQLSIWGSVSERWPAVVWIASRACF